MGNKAWRLFPWAFLNEPVGHIRQKDVDRLIGRVKTAIINGFGVEGFPQKHISVAQPWTRWQKNVGNGLRKPFWYSDTVKKLGIGRESRHFQSKRRHQNSWAENNPTIPIVAKLAELCDVLDVPPSAVSMKPYMIPRLNPTFFRSIPDGIAITK